MADDNSAGAVFIELGIDLNRLESDFIAADQTIQQNLNSLNRERNLIELRAQVEIGGLDKVADADKILEVQTRALNHQMQIQRDRIRLVEAAHRQLANSQGESATATMNMEMRLNRERLMLQRLERQLQQTTQAQENLSSGGSSTNNSTSKLKDLFSANFNDKFKQLNEMLPLAGGLAEKTTAALAAIPTPAKAAILAITAIPVAVKATESAILSLAEPAITAGDAFYVASRGAQMTIKDFGQLSTICKVTGIELSEVTNAMRRLNMQIVKGGDSAALKMLRRYGVEVRNTNGELKNALEMSLAVAEGLEKAQAAGKSKDFIAGVFGRQATGDIVTYLEDLKGNVELAKSIVKNGLFDPVRAHNIQGEINAMNTQAAQLGSAFSSALLPIAEELVPHITKRMGELTKVIEENADGIKAIAESIAEVTGTVSDLIAKIVELGAKGIGTAGHILDSERRQVVNEFGTLTKEIKSEEDLMQRELAKMSPTERAALIPNSQQMKLFESKVKKQWQEISKWRDENIKSMADFKKADEEATKKYLENQKSRLDAEFEEFRNTSGIAKKIQDLKLDLKFDGDEYGKSLAKLELQYQEELKQHEGNEKIKNEITERYSLERSKIELDNRKKIYENIKSLNKNAADLEFEMTHTAFEKKLRDIELEKQAQLEKAKTVEESAAIVANAAAKEAQAFEDEIDRIRGKTQTLQEKIFGLTHSQRDKDIYNLEKEIAELASEGIYDQREILRYANLSLAKIRQNKDKSYIQQPNLPQKFNLPIENFWAQIQDKVDAYTNIQQAKLKQSMAEQKGYKLPTIDFSPINAQIKTFDSSLLSASNAANNFSNALNENLNKINNLQLNTPTKTFNRTDTNSIPANLRDNNKNQRIKEAAQKVAAKATENNFAIPSLSKELNQMTRQISELTQIAGSIAQDAQKRQQYQPPNITVQPNININLGGAYVFDNQMKAQLTDDITAEVANAVKSAVNQGLNQADFSIRG